MSSRNGSVADVPFRILFVDAYDSFSNNIVALLKTTLDNVEVDIVRIDSIRLRDGKDKDKKRWIASDLQSYDGIVCGPGPGTPLNPKDVGLFNSIWNLEQPTVPVLGICLGFQSLVAHHGGKIRRLKRGLHGMVREIEHNSTSLFQQVPPFSATLYHSLCADIGQDDISSEDWKIDGKWSPTTKCPDLLPLAWTTERRNGSDERILMAVKHIKKPFWGLQYHPESVCTDPTAREVLNNWFRLALAWNKRHNRKYPRTSLTDFHTMLKTESDKSLSHCSILTKRVRFDFEPLDEWFSPDWISNNPKHPKSIIQHHLFGAKPICMVAPLPDGAGVPDVVDALGLAQSEAIILDSSSSITGDPLARFSIIAVDVEKALRFEYRAGNDVFNVSLPHGNDDGSDINEQVRLTHNAPSSKPVSFWEVLSAFWMARKGEGLEDYDLPFQGGFMGWVTYEMGLHGLDPTMVHGFDARKHLRPDICMAWISRSVVIDHAKKLIYVQNLAMEDSSEDLWWSNDAMSRIETSPRWQELLRREKSASDVSDSSTNWSIDLARSDSGSEMRGTFARELPDHNLPMADDNFSISDDKSQTTDSIHEWLARHEPQLVEQRSSLGRSRRRLDDIFSPIDNRVFLKEKPVLKSTMPQPYEQLVTEPCPQTYEEQVRVCQDKIAAGDSYELCLTTQTTMKRPRKYRERDSLGSPWTMYQELRKRQPAPFGSFFRIGGATLLSSSPERFLSHDSKGFCSMRPMKGTVRKSEAVSTLAQANEILHVPKEEAENLMIVDLVRHDLHGICDAGNVTVPDLMKVEEYATVFQMITVVSGRMCQRDDFPHFPHIGFDALSATLPPGSMTGAPKKRSCQILQEIETQQDRSLYSGVVGYMDITGNGDWSVTIRSMFHWDDEVIWPEGEGTAYEKWNIGAGGAVTILSTPEGEREEMFTKLAGPLGVWRDTAYL